MEPTKPVRLTTHARERCLQRGASEMEVIQAVLHGTRERAKRGRWMYRLNRPYGMEWEGRAYAMKQIVPVVAETDQELVVITVYTLYF